MEKHNKFILYSSGIFICYFYFGILQEKVTRGKYSYDVVDDEGNKSTQSEKYIYTLALVFVQCLISLLMAKGACYIWPQAEDKTKSLYHASVASTYLLAMVASNMALRWINYPTQVVGKSAKPIPVLLLGVLVGKKSYPLRKYFFIFFIVVGVILFMYKDKAAANHEVTFGVGELLLILSLTMDGLTGAVQERIRAEAAPSGFQMMLKMNAWAVLFLAGALLVTGEGVEFILFTGRYPYVIYQLVALGLTQGIGQIFIMTMVSEFGPLPASVVTTTRKFFTVLGSVLFFGNVLSVRQWIGAVIVFTFLFLDAFYSKGAPKKK